MAHKYGKKHPKAKTVKRSIKGKKYSKKTKRK